MKSRFYRSEIMREKLTLHITLKWFLKCVCRAIGAKAPYHFAMCSICIGLPFPMISSACHRKYFTQHHVQNQLDSFFRPISNCKINSNTQWDGLPSPLPTHLPQIKLIFFQFWSVVHSIIREKKNIFFNLTALEIPCFIRIPSHCFRLVAWSFRSV